MYVDRIKERILKRAKELADAHDYESPKEYNKALRYYFNEVSNVMSPYAIPETGQQTHTIELPDSMLKKDGYGNLPRGDNENNVATHKEMGDKSFSDNVSSTIKSGIEGGRKMLAPIYHAAKRAVDIYSGQAAIDEYERAAKIANEIKGLVPEVLGKEKEESSLLSQIIKTKKDSYEDSQKRMGDISSGYDRAHELTQEVIAKSKANTEGYTEAKKSYDESKLQYDESEKSNKKKQAEDLADSQARAKAKVESEYAGKSPTEILAHYAKKYNRPDYAPAPNTERSSSDGRETTHSLPTPAEGVSPYSIEAYSAKKKASMAGRSGYTKESTGTGE